MAHPITRTLVQLATALVLVIVMFIGYASFTESRAEAKAREFCEHVKIGESSETLLSRARTAGADERQTRWLKVQVEEPWLPVTFTGVTPLSRHICSIRGGNVVKEFHYVYLD